MDVIVPSVNTKNILELSTKEYETQLPESPGEQSLLARGISRETQNHFRLGYVESPLTGDSSYRSRITIPYLTITGVVAIRYKASTTESRSKVLSSPGDSGRPYNVAALSGVGPIFICEGEPDTWTAWQLGMNALGFPGAEAWRSTYSRMLRFHQLRVFAHGDTAGRKFAEEVARDCAGTQIIDLPDKQDVNSLYQQDPEYFERWTIE